MRKQTTPAQRRDFYQRHQGGETYAAIGEQYGVSEECVRYWCRRQRDGGRCESVYRGRPAGRLRGFHALVRYSILRLRLKHPRWGANRLRARMKKLAWLGGLALPSEASIGRYLHQWPKFRRRPPVKREVRRPAQPTVVHQRWQLDFKEDIVLRDGTRAILHTLRDPVGEACLAAQLYATQVVTSRQSRAELAEVRMTLRTAFANWGMPQQIQTDGDPALVAQPGDSLPSKFTLWLVGLGLEHLVIRSGQPTDNAEVERCHRTVYDYGIVGNEHQPLPQLQVTLDEAMWELLMELPSRAQGCAGRPPAEAHPELFETHRPYRPEHELARFDLQRVDAYLATFTWQRKVGKSGQVCLGGHHQYYAVGRKYARRLVRVKFDPADRHFVFYDSHQPNRELARRPARNLEVEDLTGLATWPRGLGPQQLSLPLLIPEGVNC